jgi:hypothetical protein
MPDAVRCRDCGFLALHGNQGEVLELGLRARETKAQSWGTELNEISQHFEPFCFARAMDLKLYFQKDYEKIVQTINQQRQCAQFVEWQTGLSPRGHKEMILSKQMIESQERFQAEQRERDRQWQEEMKRLDDERARARDAKNDERARERDVVNDERARARDFQNRMWGLALLIIGVIIGAILKR